MNVSLFGTASYPARLQGDNHLDDNCNANEALNHESTTSTKATKAGLREFRTLRVFRG
jgi:hypothetical protein